MDYAGNSKKEKEESSKPDKKIERVITTDVVVQKRSLGRKFRDLFIEADLRSVTKYVIGEVLLPAFRNMIVDGSTKGIERMMYGEPAVRRRNFGSGPRITYNSPIARMPRDSDSASYGRRTAPQSRTASRAREDFILSSREEAELVLERMNDIIDNYDMVSVADLNDLVGFPTSHIDNKWGWINLADVQIRQIREGYLIDLPQPDPLQ
jgi:hypothetical protein